MERVGKIFSFLLHLIFILLIFALAVFTSLLFGFWKEYPSGFDAPGHVFRVSFVARFWPDINWLPVWAQGMPIFTRYSPLAFFILGLLQRVTSFTFQQLITGASVFAVGLGAVGIYLFINELTRLKLTALAGAAVYVLTPSIWMMGRTGGYARGYAVPFLILALWAAAMVVRDLIERKERKPPCFLTVLFLGLCFFTHFVVGFFGFALVGFWILGFWRVIRIKRLFLAFVRIFIPAVLITSPMWLPILAFRTPRSEPGVGSLNWENIKAISWSWLLNFNPAQKISPYDVIKLTPFLYPLVAFLWVLALISRKGKLAVNTFLGRAILLLSAVSLLALFYVRIVSPIFGILYAGILGHASTLIYLPVFLASLVGVLIFFAFRHRVLAALFSVLVIVGVVFWAGERYKLIERGWEDLKQTIPFNLQEDKYPLVNKAIKNKKGFNFRFGTSTAVDLASWFNLIYPFVPQTRDYFAAGIVNIDDDVYKTNTIWEATDNWSETEFILDWFGVDKFVVMPTNEEVEGKYEAKPERYQFLGAQLLGAQRFMRAFEYVNPSPILAANDAPPVLVIGREVYDVIFRSLAQGNINSRYLIPVVGEERVDDYTLEELKKFPLIFLYNYQFKNKEEAFGLLVDYVKEGGGLVIEGNIFVEEGQELPEPFPVSLPKKRQFSGNWDLGFANELKGVNLAKFAPPIYEEGPWGGMVAGKVRSWAKALVSRQGEPIIVGGQLGQGRVVWSGMNLPYHIVTYHVAEEAKLMGLLLAWTKEKKTLEHFEILEGKSRDLTYETTNFVAQFVNPQEFRLKLKKGAKGALYKGFYFPGWQVKAILTDGKRQSLPINKAGPRMIYAFVPPGTKEVVFQYGLPLIAKLARITTLLTLIGLVLYLLTEKLYLDRLFVSITKSLEKFKLSLSHWWEKDEA